MSKTIWKFPLVVEDEQLVAMPRGAALLDVQVQGGVGPCLWALVHPGAPKVLYRILTRGTGHQVAAVERDWFLRHVGTYQLSGGALVFHVFAECPPTDNPNARPLAETPS